jgi:YidC/Oxa1 family membrane protein insertase
MDKRLIIFVVALGITLFGVNYYFHQQHEKELQIWKEQKQAKQEVKNKEEKPEASSFKSDYVASSAKKEEQFYVIENGYQQLVFSNYGGALAEINLPFQSESYPSSVVKETDFDRDMVKNHPQNAHFPSHPYNLPGDIKKEGKLGGYYPLIRRDLLQNNGYKSVTIPPRFYALNIVSEYPEVAEMVYEVKEFTKNKIVFEGKQALRTITKTFTLDADGGPYALDLEVKIEGDSRGLYLNSGVPEVEWISGSAAPVLKYRITRGSKPDVELIDLPQDTKTISSINPDWLATSNGFFGVILDALTERGNGYRASYVSGTEVPSRLVEIDQQYDLYPADKMPGYQVMVPLKSSPGETKFRVFAGPFASNVLKELDAAYTNPETGYNPDYIASQTFHGWFAFISEPFAKFLFLLMQAFYWLTGSWGFSIILLTVALRVMLYPLNAWSLKSTINMQKIAPDVKAIQDKYKKDPQKAQVEVINLYRERGVNPLSGCLPLLIQMPFLIGMFDLLKSTFELRGASFIPGWINDLSAPDTLFSWGYPVFFIGNAFHLLPFLLGGVMFLQQRMMSTTPANPAEMTDQQRQQKAMGTMMTVMFTVMFYHFPSGLNIYWLSSMLLGMLQQWWTSKRMAGAPLKIKASTTK